MDFDAKRAKTQKELDQLAAFVFRWRWPLTGMFALVDAPDAYDLYAKRVELLKAVIAGSIMNGTFYHAFGQDIVSIIGFPFIMIMIWSEVGRHQSFLAQEELKHTAAPPEAWPPAPRI